MISIFLCNVFRLGHVRNGFTTEWSYLTHHIVNDLLKVLVRTTL